MNIIPTFDASAASAPAGFALAVHYVCNLYAPFFQMTSILA